MREVDGVLWINDSKSTNVTSTEVAVAALDRPFVLLLGGRHKGEPYTRLVAPLRGRCRAVVAYGEAGPLVIAGPGRARCRWCRRGSFDEVLATARRLARPGDAVLLSPACSSYDMFKNYEERGARFRAGRGGDVTDAAGPAPRRAALGDPPARHGDRAAARIRHRRHLRRREPGRRVHGQNVGLDFAMRQLSGALLGGVLLLLASRQDYYRWRTLAWPLLLVTLVLLLIPVLPFTNGDRADRSTAPGAGSSSARSSFQPSELARIAVVVWCAMLAAKKGEQVREFKKGMLPFIVVLGLVSFLILLQPNLSMATLVALLGGLVLFAAGAKIGHFILLGGRAVLLVFHQIRDAQYRLARLLTFLNPGRRDHRGAGSRSTSRSSGSARAGCSATGFGQGQQKLGYLPYAYSDFLFSTIGEEWGFVGVFVVVVALRPLLLARVPHRAHRRRSVRPVSRRRTHRGDRADGVHAHGGVARPDAHDRAHAAVHVATGARARSSRCSRRAS